MTTAELLNKVQDKSPVEGLNILAELYNNKIVFTTSFGVEDQVITDMIFSNNIDIEVITLDTGRLFMETYKVFNKTIEKYGRNIKTYYPDTASVEKMVSEKGPFSFYKSVENRKECCYIRKVEPLNRALEGMRCWITGIRASQSADRDELDIIEMDEARYIYKYNPLLNWELSDVEEYIKKHNVPYNILHDKGYVSIGCEPCTRAIKQGEDFRAGRWWWESNSSKECGLHE
ncbi:MAG TPA: phosphoadenylyl-sulfate reductase [Bacteroidales bacterium]|nr:phosphoadenylyl-sulfate reductase [Bacteroidales bacterium]